MSDNNGLTFKRHLCRQNIGYHGKWHILFIDSLSPLIYLYIKKNKIAKKTSLAKGCTNNNTVV